MPVLAIGGAESWDEDAGNGMKPAADDVQTVVIPGAGHWVAEEAPEEMEPTPTANPPTTEEGSAETRPTKTRRSS
jgi:pimeloyl-ACP methyl ester carboxylesterase